MSRDIGRSKEDLVDVLFIAGFAPIVSDPASGQRFYHDALGLPLLTNSDNPDYIAMNDIGGVKHFGVWPLAGAAESCFGVREWPADRPRHLQHERSGGRGVGRRDDTDHR